MAGNRILIVDDNLMFLALASRALESAQYEVQTLAPPSAFEVMKRCMAFKPHLAVIDFHMPRCNPETLILILKEDPGFQPLVILGISTSHVPEVEQRMLKAGADHFIHKGTMASLQEAAHRLLRA